MALMAGDWIPIRIDLADEPEVIAIGDDLGVDYDLVVGKLVKLWGWANRITTDGNAGRVTQKWVDGRVGVPGFAKAMSEVGWLTITSTGVEFPRFDVWNSQGAKQRVLGAKRAAKCRQNQPQKSNDTGVTKALPTEEKRRDSFSESGRESLFEAIAQISCSDRQVSGSHIGRICKDLAKATPPYTAADVSLLGSMLEKRGFTLPITLGTIPKYIGWTRDITKKVGGRSIDQVLQNMLNRREESRKESN